jgi:hypothetical protein
VGARWLWLRRAAAIYGLASTVPRVGHRRVLIAISGTGPGDRAMKMDSLLASSTSPLDEESGSNEESNASVVFVYLAESTPAEPRTPKKTRELQNSRTDFAEENPSI